MYNDMCLKDRAYVWVILEIHVLWASVYLSLAFRSRWKRKVNSWWWGDGGVKEG